MGLTEIINFFLVTGERAAWNGSLHRNHRVSEIVQLILTRPRHGVYVIIERDAKRFTDDIRDSVWKITDSNQQRKLKSSRLYTSPSKTTSTIKEKRKKKKKRIPSSTKFAITVIAYSRDEWHDCIKHNVCLIITSRTIDTWRSTRDWIHRKSRAVLFRVRRELELVRFSNASYTISSN